MPARNAKGKFVSRKKGTSTRARSAPKAKTRTRTVTKTIVRRRSGGGGLVKGSLGKWLPSKHEALSGGAAFVYGMAERAFVNGREAGGGLNADGTVRNPDNAKKTGGLGYQVLDMAPKFFDGLGLAGNIAVDAWVVSKLMPNDYTRAAAHGMLCVATYKRGAKGSAYKAKTDVAGLQPDIGGLEPEVGSDERDYDDGTETGYIDVDSDSYRPD